MYAASSSSFSMQYVVCGSVRQWRRRLPALCVALKHSKQYRSMSSWSRTSADFISHSEHTVCSKKTAGWSARCPDPCVATKHWLQ